MMANKLRIDLTGQKFYRLTVESLHHMEKSKAYWLCKCDCGNYKIVEGGRMRSGHTKSCGCIRPKAKVIDREVPLAVTIELERRKAMSKPIDKDAFNDDWMFMPL